MLFQLDKYNKKEVDMLLEYAKQHHIALLVVDEGGENFHLPGKPLTENELAGLITKSRSGGVISMQNAHQLIRNSYNAD